MRWKDGAFAWAFSLRTDAKHPVVQRQDVSRAWNVANEISQRSSPHKFLSSSTACWSSSKSDDKDREEHRLNGLLVLLTVPVAWGTYEPAVRFVYALDPPVPGFVFSFCYFLIASIALIAASTLQSLSKVSDESESRWPSREGIELGSYLFLGNTLQLLGLQTVPANRAAFLLQLNTIFVPLLEAFFARSLSSVSLKTWAACVLALVGVGFMELDGEQLTRSISPVDFLTVAFLHLSAGDIFIIAAALVYSFHILRLEKFASRVSAVKLAAVKATTECSWTAFLIVAVTNYARSVHGETLNNGIGAFFKGQGNDIKSFFSSLTDTVGLGSRGFDNVLPAVLATIWTGLVTIAYTIYAQTIGQKTIDAVTSNLIFTIQPVCTAVFAWILLREQLGLEGYIGAVLIAVAVLLASTSKSNNTASRQPCNDP